MKSHHLEHTPGITIRPAKSGPKLRAWAEDVCGMPTGMQDAGIQPPRAAKAGFEANLTATLNDEERYGKRKTGIRCRHLDGVLPPEWIPAEFADWSWG